MKKILTAIMAIIVMANAMMIPALADEREHAYVTSNTEEDAKEGIELVAGKRENPEKVGKLVSFVNTPVRSEKESATVTSGEGGMDLVAGWRPNPAKIIAGMRDNVR